MLQDVEIPQNPIEVVDLIISEGRLERILRLPEAPRRRVYTQRGGRNREEIDIPLAAVLRQWIQGADLVTLANTYFYAVADIDFRFEQLGDFIYDYFEIFLPWMFGTVITWTNSMLEEIGSRTLLPRSISANVRWGIDNPIALELMAKGIQSRSLALRVARVWQSEDREERVHSWVRSMSVADWQRAFDASPGELRSILEFSRDRRGGAAVELITQGSTELEVASHYAEYDQTDALLVPVDESELSPVDIRIADQIVGQILGRDQEDVRSLLNTGLIFSVRFSASSGQGLLKLELVEPAA